ncbi:MAG: hypothetical protein ABGZ53_31030 [Fuerstiella sp.]
MIDNRPPDGHHGYPLGLNGQPVFHSADHWLAHYHLAMERGELAWPPQTRDELLIAEQHGLFDRHPSWIPCSIGLRLLNLPEIFGRVQRPFGERFKERLLSSLVTDPEFATALHSLINHREG